MNMQEASRTLQTKRTTAKALTHLKLFDDSTVVFVSGHLADTPLARS